MILLFGEAAKSKTSSTKRMSGKNNNPVENAGVLAMGFGTAKSYLSENEYDTYSFSTPAVVNFADYAGAASFDEASVGFMGEFSSAVAALGGCGSFNGGGFSGSTSSYSGGASCGASCGGFSSFG